MVNYIKAASNAYIQLSKLNPNKVTIITFNSTDSSMTFAQRGVIVQMEELKYLMHRPYFGSCILMPEDLSIVMQALDTISLDGYNQHLLVHPELLGFKVYSSESGDPIGPELIYDVTINSISNPVLKFIYWCKSSFYRNRIRINKRLE